MTITVDVHIIRSEKDNPAWYQECVDSLEREPVVVHEIPAVKNHVGQGRATGFALGDNPYVASVDPDDKVCRGAFAKCIEALERDPTAVLAYTKEAMINEDGILIFQHPTQFYTQYLDDQKECTSIHHLCIYRRSMLPDLSLLLDYPYGEEFALRRALRDRGRFIFVNTVGYQWRRHAGQVSKKFARWPTPCKNAVTGVV